MTEERSILGMAAFEIKDLLDKHELDKPTSARLLVAIACTLIEMHSGCTQVESIKALKGIAEEMEHNLKHLTP